MLPPSANCCHSCPKKLASGMTEVTKCRAFPVHSANCWAPTRSSELRSHFPAFAPAA